MLTTIFILNGWAWCFWGFLGVFKDLMGKKLSEIEFESVLVVGGLWMLSALSFIGAVLANW